MIQQRTIYKAIEPITVVVAFPAARDVKLDIFDPVTRATLLEDVDMTEFGVDLPGVYSKTFETTELDALDGEETDRVFLWRARVDPAEDGVDDQHGTFYRGGFVDQSEQMMAIRPSFASVDVPERNLFAGMLSHIDYPLGHGFAARKLFSYREGTADISGVTVTIVADE